jgi:uncharacterized protein DUF1877
MSLIGELYRVPARRLEEMLADPEQIRSELYPDDADLSSSRRARFGCDVDKAWDGIQFLLDRLAERRCIPWIAPLPWHAAVEGSETGVVLHYGPVCYRGPQQVAEIAGALLGISEDGLRQVYDPERMTEEMIYPQIWDRPDEFDYLWSHFQSLAQFYREAASHGDGVLLWLS